MSAATVIRAIVMVVLGVVLAHGQATEGTKGTAADTLPPPRTEYMGRTIAQTMHYRGAPWLVRESRTREEDCQTMLEQLRLQPGMVVCDMGCGNGFYTLQMAPQVLPGGEILAVDIQAEMLRLLEDRAEKSDLSNVRLIHSTVIDPRLPVGKVDLILCVDVYHEFSHPELMLKAMRSSLSPKGLLVLVEFREEDPNVPIKPLHKMSKKQILREMEANGFTLHREFDGLPWQHMMFFRPPTP